MSADRYVGMDVHKKQVVVAAVDARQQQLFAPQKVDVREFEAWARQHLRITDHVALEATTNSWGFHDHLKPLVKEVSVANTFKLQLISSSGAKTDKHDALILARLSAAHLLPTVWVPPQEVRELRTLTDHRVQLIQQRTAAKNRLHSLLHRHNISLPEENPFKPAHQEWWKTLPLSLPEQMQIRHEWASIDFLNQLLSETEQVIADLSVSEAWRDSMTFLMQIPGVGLYTGMTILAAIGDVHRFPDAQHLVGYAGLGARVWASGEAVHTGRISKQGSSELRASLVASAWVAVRYSDHGRQLFAGLSQRIGIQKAITAIARKILVLIWHALTKHEWDRSAHPVAIARSFMTWSSAYHLAHTLGQKRLSFVRQRLELLGVLDQVSSFRANGRAHFLLAKPWRVQ